ncbi:hypothetical protein ABZ690_34290 [Streptomyces sp. NPDC006967]|uniref:hypothetical protein n=1 Tax=Streptomyces sp. NPDC006967 TaxID=3156906 RepID=UPI0033D26BE9
MQLNFAKADDDTQADGPDLDECPCPKPDDQYLLEIDAGSVFLKHTACGKPPRASGEMVETLQLDPVSVQIRPESNCTGWHYEYSCDCDFWAQATITGLPEQATTTRRTDPVTGPEHYLEAQRLLSAASHEGITGRPVTKHGMPMSPELHAALIARAQVHAQLAAVAATAMQAAVDGSEPGMGSAEFQAWYDAAGVKPTTTKEN